VQDRERECKSIEPLGELLARAGIVERRPDSDEWALVRMAELLRQGVTGARFRVCWIDRGGKRLYRVEIRREDGTIERPIRPLPLGGKVVEEGSRCTSR